MESINRCKQKETNIDAKAERERDKVGHEKRKTDVER